MPFRRKRKRTFKRKRRSFRSKRRRTNSRKGPSRVIVRNPFGPGTAGAFPREYWCQMPFQQSLSGVADGSGLQVSQAYLNDIRDPGSTSSSRNAKYLSILGEVYENWVVMAVRWKITFVNLSTTEALEVTAVAFPNIVVPTDMTDMRVYRGTVSRMLGPSNGGRNIGVLKGYVNMSQLFGLDVTKDNNYWGAGTTTAPNRIGALNNIQLWSALAAGGTSYFKKEMTYYVKFFGFQQTDDQI